MTLLPDTPLFPTGQDHYKDWQGLSNGSLAAVLAEVARGADGPLLVAAPDSSRALADRYITMVITTPLQQLCTDLVDRMVQQVLRPENQHRGAGELEPLLYLPESV